MILHTMPQRSEEWFACRLGKFTASDFCTLMPSARQKDTEWNKTKLGIIYRVAAERMTGRAVSSSFTTAAMQHGIDTEDEARASFIFDSGLDVDEVGFVDIEPGDYAGELAGWVGCSPDGIISGKAGLELKCPNSDTHLKYRACPDKLLADYRWQCIGGLLCTGFERWHLYSYDPRFPRPELQSVSLVIERNADELEMLKNRLISACAYVQAMVS